MTGQSAAAVGVRNGWPLSSVMPPMGALTSAPGSARAHVRTVLTDWHLDELADTAEMVVSEMVTNAVNASTAPPGRVMYFGGRMAVVRLCLLSDGARLLVECHDQAAGIPALTDAAAECGRGLAMVHALTGGRWGWHAAPGRSGKCVWAVLSLAGPIPFCDGLWTVS